MKNILKEDIGVRVIDRDNPWDFSLELSNGDEFNIEITSIADNEYHFKKLTREKEFSNFVCKDFVTLKEMNKMNQYFSNSISDDFIDNCEALSKGGQQLFKNPIQDGKRLFLSASGDTHEPMSHKIKKVLAKKIKKNHTQKDQTIIVIDNRMGEYSYSDYVKSCEELNEYLDRLPFREVWFYTGYYSDLECRNCEYSFAPMKISKDNEKAFLDLCPNDLDSKVKKIIYID